MNSKEVSQFIINEIKSLENLAESFNNLLNVPKIDIDYALDKTRKVYDLLYQLKDIEVIEAPEIVISDNEVKENYEAPIIVKEEVISDKNTEEVIENEKIIVANNNFEEEIEEIIIEEDIITDNNIEIIEEKIENELTEDVVKENIFEEEKEEPNIETSEIEQEIINESNITTNEITKMIENDDDLLIIEGEETVEPELFPKEEIIEAAAVDQTEIFSEKDEELIDIVSDEQQTVSEKYEDNGSRTLNDLIAKLNETKDLSARLGEAPIANIKSSISLNDKIGFINELFDGNAKNYNETIETLNNFSNLDQALEFINNKFEWKDDSDAFTNFLKIVYRRFMTSI